MIFILFLLYVEITVEYIIAFFLQFVSIFYLFFKNFLLLIVFYIEGLKYVKLYLIYCDNGGFILQYGYGETVLNGRACGSHNDVLIGRVRIFKGEIGVCRENSILCIDSHISVGRALQQIERLACVSAFVCEEKMIGQIAPMLIDSGVCVFVADTLQSLDSACDGRIALIDFADGSMIVDPTLDTLEKYSQKREACLQKQERLRESIICECGILPGCEGSQVSDRGLLCSARQLETRGDLLDMMLSLTESMPSGELCIGIDIAKDEKDESFCERADAVFRAAVYGKLSVMLERFLSPGDVERSFHLMNQSFCRLEASGREINGYLARGVMIDRPIGLFARKLLSRVDFICFDFDALCSGLVGSNGDIDKRAESALCKFWSEYKHSSELHEKTELRARSDALFKSKFFSEWVDFMGVGEIYLPRGCTM